MNDTLLIAVGLAPSTLAAFAIYRRGRETIAELEGQIDRLSTNLGREIARTETARAGARALERIIMERQPVYLMGLALKERRHKQNEARKAANAVKAKAAA